MSKQLKVLPLDGVRLTGEQYDVSIYAVGFESRCTFVAKHINPSAKTRYAIAFTDRKTHTFEQNVAWYTDAGYTVLHQTDDEFYHWIMGLSNDCTSFSSRLVKICIDYSSMSRFRIASLASAFLKGKCRKDVQIDWVYSSALFSTPDKSIKPIVKAGPVLAEFAGCPEDPELPISVIIGLGYEYEKALGVIEYLEPAAVFLLKPTRHNTKYAAAVHTANELLWRSVLPEQVIEYSVSDPIGTFISLESLVFGCLQSSRVALVPFGPKSLFLNSLFVAHIHDPHVSVWRVSSGEYEPSIDRVPDGKTLATRTYITTNGILS